MIGSRKLTDGLVKNKKTLVIRRLLASLLDFLFVTFIYMFLYFLVNHILDILHVETIIFDVSQVFVGYVLFYYGYYVCFDAFGSRSTLGKSLLHLQVVTIQGERPSILQSLFRNFLRLLSILTFGIGLWVQLIKKDHVAFYNSIAKTRVVLIKKSGK